MRSSIVVLIFSIVQIGCSSSYIVSSIPNHGDLSFSQFNDEANDRSATIVFHNGSILHGQQVLSEPYSTSWLDPTKGVRAAVPNDRIEKIVFSNRTRGTLEGAGIGLLAGGAAGFLVGSTLGSNSSTEVRGWNTLVLSILGSGVGFFAGIFDGLAEGHTYEYKFGSQAANR